MSSTRQGWVLGCHRQNPELGQYLQQQQGCGDVHGHHAAQSCLHSCLSSQCCLDVMQMGGSAGLGSRDSREQKSFWEHSGMGKRSGAVGRGGDVALEIWAFDGENSHLNMLQGVQLCLGLPPLPSLDYFPL